MSKFHRCKGTIKKGHNDILWANILLLFAFSSPCVKVLISYSYLDFRFNKIYSQFHKYKSSSLRLEIWLYCNCCVFWPVNAWSKTMKMMEKVPFPSFPREAHVRRMKKNEEKSFIVFDLANTCASMHLLVEIHIMQQINDLFFCYLPYDCNVKKNIWQQINSPNLLKHKAGPFPIKKL